MNSIFCLAFLLALAVTVVMTAEPKESLSTRSTKAEGVIKCNGVPIEKAYVRLFKGNSDDIKDVLATTQTDRNGHFVIEGNTANYQGTEANIDPFLKIYHKCNDAEKKKGYRRVTLRYPRDFVSILRLPRRTYSIGTLNMAVEYPGEVRVDEIQGI